MKRFSNAGDKIQTLAVVLSIIGTLFIVFIYVTSINKYDEIHKSNDPHDEKSFTVEELDDDQPMKTIVNMFIDEESDVDDIVRVSMIILMIKSMLVFWFWMLLLYAFGELCENVYDLNHSSRVTFYDDFERFKEGQKNSSPLENALTGNPALDSQKVWACPSCGKQNRFSSRSCVNCGHSRT